jgi:hypothetical protein
LVFYFLYQSMNIHLASGIMGRVNQAKLDFAKTLGDPQKRAQFFAEKFAAANADVVFVQECDRHLPKEMAKLGYFSTERRPVSDKDDPANTRWELNSKDGSVVFLNSKTFKGAWVHPYDEGNDPKHKTTVVTADLLDFDRPMILASSHVSDGNNKSVFSIIERVANAYEKEKHAGFVIGLDANPQSREDEENIRGYVKDHHHTTVKAGPTSWKKRKISLLERKVNLPVCVEKNMIIANAPTNFTMTNVTVGFKKPPLNTKILLPSQEIPSDQAPLGLTMDFKR